MFDAGVRMFALTDHDSTDGLKEAATQARALDIKFVNGVEISTRWERQTIHVVGLGVQTENAELLRGLKFIQQLRKDRAAGIARKLEREGVADALSRARKLAEGGQITRNHFAQLLVEDGRVKDKQKAFKQFLADGKRAYVKADWPAMQTAIHWIKSAQGLAVLAHPMRYGMTGSKRRRMIEAFADAGGDALEMGGGPNTAADTQVIAEDARRLGLMGSVGSDFHDPAQGWIKLGICPPLPADISPVWTHPRLSDSSAVIRS